jgi:hypothetical protein
LPRHEADLGILGKASNGLGVLPPSAADSTGVDQEHLKDLALANRALEQFRVRAPAIVGRRDGAVLANNLVNRALAVQLIRRQVMPARSIFRFHYCYEWSQPEHHVWLNTAGEARPKPAVDIVPSLSPSGHLEPSAEEIPSFDQDECAEDRRGERVLTPFWFGDGGIELAVKQCVEHQETVAVRPALRFLAIVARTTSSVIPAPRFE